MENPYVIVILSSLLIVFSYLFTQISKWTKIPSVIFLIGTGVAIQFLLKSVGVNIPDLSQYLSLLGVVGLMMIVLEGALDIKLHRNKIRTILAAFATSVLILGITNSLISGIIFFFLEVDFIDAFLYAIPLSVVSSAIVIPSVHTLIPAKKEFMILEATLSDIFGIMLFAFWIKEPQSGQSYFEAISWNIVISVGVSILMSYILVYVFHKIKTEIKFFLFLSILALLYSVGEYFHYSALLIILIFGLVLNNTHAFFRWKLKGFVNHEKVKEVRQEFVIITNETSFLIRTFFFVVFGLTMNLKGLFHYEAIVISALIMGVIFFTRALNLKVFLKSTIFPQMLIAPRGLVTILLFNKIVEHYDVVPFDEAILAWVIIGTNLVMMLGLIFSGSTEDDILRINVGDASSTELDHKFYVDIDENEDA
ncbi:sodium:proton exchanger [Vicingus serpentipes]|uniref:Sodium:proton exchanger n=1 Tax=Vicingus serpentipes TaxID=1926625 RepID=A0A5C6RTX5_9FLAO|nr:cation:proton antiporter [Vicingus serpentipes]TXB65120.1 sodium:proton exchanger [Vicingus serpentipes]